MTSEELAVIHKGVTGLVTHLLAEPLLRMKALETVPAPRDGRDGAPGRDGLPGRDGVDGQNGKDGAEGLGFGDLVVDHDGERTFTLKAVRGEIVKPLGVFTLPVAIYRGVWMDGKAYDPHDSVTWAGSEWHCQIATTTKPGDGSKAWTLKVKRGRDGRDTR
jgi:hypothetical protein